MAGPLNGLSAAQVAQQKMQDQATQQGAKQGPSKFDETMKSKGAGASEGVNPAQSAKAATAAQSTQAAQAVSAVQQVQASQKMSATVKVQDVAKNEKAKSDKKLSPDIVYEEKEGFSFDPVTQKSEVGKGQSAIMSMLSSMERGQANMDKLINTSMSGVQFSNQELLQMQAGMYRYTQELELTGKVVEKATTGLKDTLKTQV